MKGIVGIDQHQIECIIGIHPEERVREQPIFVDIQVETDFSKCQQTDNLAHTVDYDVIAKLCTDLAKQGQYNLMETYACAVLETMFSRFEVSWAWIRVKKPQNWGEKTCTTVELERYKNGT